jgi:NADH-quinone oxidoreductase subunit M
MSAWQTFGTLLPTLLVLIPLAGALVPRGSRNRPSTGKLLLALVVLEGTLALLPVFGLPVFRGSEDPFAFLALAALSVVTGISLRAPVFEASGGPSRRAVEYGFLFLFFSAGFLLAPNAAWAVAFWEGVLASFWLTLGSRLTASGEDRILGTFRAPVILSGLLFPVSQWLGGHLPFLPSPGTRPGLGYGLSSSGAFSISVLSFLLFCPFFPFQRWMTLHPERTSPIDFLPMRSSLVLLATAGIFRWGVPMMDPDFVSSLPAFLFLVIAAQIAGAISAWRDPSLKGRISLLGFSQMTIPVQALFWEKTDTRAGIAAFEVSMLMTICLMAYLADHIERTTRRIRIGDLSGLHRELPRSERLFLAGTLALAGIPGFGVFVGAIPALSPSLAFGLFPALFSLFGIFLVQAVLWQTFERIFLGPAVVRSLPPTDLPSRQSWTLALLLLPVLFLGLFPGWLTLTSDAVMHQAFFKGVLP